jgi:hypothetical protein
MNNPPMNSKLSVKSNVPETGWALRVDGMPAVLEDPVAEALGLGDGLGEA